MSDGADRRPTFSSEHEHQWQPRPPVFPLGPVLPERVTVYEVGPRDGLQAEKSTVPTAVKAEFCSRLVDAGIGAIETTSFVSPTWVPQLADADDLTARLDLPDTVRQVVLTPNPRGLARAVSAGQREVAVFVSATETFAGKNLNTTMTGAIDAARAVTGEAIAHGMKVRGYISMCFGDPWEGAVEPSTVARTALELFDMGCSSISLGDTIGMATPGHVHAVLDAIRSSGIDISTVAGHFHDTYGQALANVYAAMTCGVSEFDSAAGGLGRCPFARGATGNLATEDLVWMLDGLGVDTGVDVNSLVSTSLWMSEQIGHASPSRVVRALSAARTP